MGTFKKYKRKKLQQKPILGLIYFNDAVQFFTSAKTTKEARLSAIQAMQEKHPDKLKLLADYLVKEHVPHWKRVRNGDDYKFCKYVFTRLSPSVVFESDLINMERFVTVSIGAGRSAVVRKYGKRQPCEIHPNKMGNSEGRCSTCQQRIKKLIAVGVVNENTPHYVVDKILRLPSYKVTGRAGGFINEARQIVKSLITKWAELKNNVELDFKPSVRSGLHKQNNQTAKENTL